MLTHVLSCRAEPGATPPGTWVTVTSDHGELFGEGGWFGHGPVVHEKVFEVPLVEGLAR